MSEPKCKGKHFNIPTGETCPDCGRVIRRNAMGREMIPTPEPNTPESLDCDDEDYSDEPMNNEGIPIPELPNDSEHVQYWDDIEETCEIAKTLFIRTLTATMSYALAEQVLSPELPANCFDSAKKFVAYSRLFKTDAAEQFRKRDAKKFKV